MIVFEPLTHDELTQIVDLLVDEERQRLEERGLTFALTPAAREALVKEGYDPAFGARPLRRIIQRRVENPLSKELLRGGYEPGDCITVDYGEPGRRRRRLSLLAAARRVRRGRLGDGGARRSAARGGAGGRVVSPAVARDRALLRDRGWRGRAA